eukprot:8187011-Lingulodinium_polyedra.AAC.1
MDERRRRQARGLACRAQRALCGAVRLQLRAQFGCQRDPAALVAQPIVSGLSLPRALQRGQVEVQASPRAPAI